MMYTICVNPICENDQIKGPGGEQIHDFRNKISERYEFVVHKKGVYGFCFINRSPYHETIDFDVQVGHFTFRHQHAKEGEFKRCFFYLFAFKQGEK